LGPPWRLFGERGPRQRSGLVADEKKLWRGGAVCGKAVAMAETTVSVNDLVATLAEFAERVGVSARQVEKFAAQGVMVRISHGRYLTFASVRNIIAKLSAAASGREGGPASQARAKLLASQARQAEMKEAVLRGDLVRAAEVTAVNSAVFREIRSRSLALPARLAGKIPHLTAAEVAIIDDEVRAFLTLLADPSSYPDTWQKSWPVEARGETAKSSNPGERGGRGRRRASSRALVVTMTQ
jgi:terminase small subunit / prophage DNA-packing protein